MRATAFFAFCFIACTGHRPTPWPEVRGVSDPATRRELTQGPVIGFADSAKTHAWLGLPYAAPPVADLRWRAPRPASSWGPSVREATVYSAVCPQFGNALTAGKESEVIGSEDCLTLNVAAPQMSAAQVAGEHRAVMVWVHGGGNSIGTGNAYGAMRNLAAKYGVIVVSVNYRLGLLGWFHHAAINAADATPEDTSGNFGTLDLIASLKWVQANIKAFGGDPGNVTVFGESAGGFNAFSLLASPLAQGLFHRVIIESGVPASRTIAEAENFSDAPDPGLASSSSELLLKWLIADGRAATRDDAKKLLGSMKTAEVGAYLRSKSPAALLAPLQGAPFGMYAAPAIFRDGLVEPIASITEVLADPAQGNHVPVLLGTNRDELKLFMAFNPRYVGKTLGLFPFIRDEAVYDRDAALGSDMWKAIGTDGPARALTQAQGNSVFAYRFDWDEEPTRLGVPVSRLLGAAHGLEIGFVFDDVTAEMDVFKIASDENAPGRIELADAISSYWANFAITGAPGRGVDGTLPEWAPYGAGQFMVLDSKAGGGPRMQAGVITPEALEARIWADPSIGDTAAQCKAAATVLYGFFGKPTGAWTAAREASFHSHCPKDTVEAVMAQPR